MDIELENDNTDEVVEALSEATKRALKAVGMEASGDVVDHITSVGAVDTGLMRNSITFALSGESPRLASYTADKAKAVNGQLVLMRGRYTGIAPSDKIPTVYIGTNVEYAKYIHFGTSRMKHNAGEGFMSIPIKANLGHYKDIIIEELKKG